MENKGLKALNEIKWYHINTDGTIERCEIIKKELDRLEKYDKAKELIKKKKVDVIHILYLSKKYVRELCLPIYNKQALPYHQLAQEEFDFILEVFK